MLAERESPPPADTNPAFLKPMMARKRPMPMPIARFIVIGTARTTA